ncbi:MAG: OmpA family protein [Deltaproteobacteria bacterium]|nr:MAG: OmpA family protein [Deltaproteobacteria bacterium]
MIEVPVSLFSLRPIPVGGLALAGVVAGYPATSTAGPTGGATKHDASDGEKATPVAERPWIRRVVPARNMIEIGVYGGAFFAADDHDFYDPATAPQKPLWKVGIGDWGLRFAYFPLSFLGLEIEGNVVPTFARTATNDPVLLYGFRGHPILRLPGYRISPFALGGFGLMGVRSAMDVVGRDVDPIAHYGVGVELFAHRFVALRLEGRHLMGAKAARQNDVTHHFEVLFGVSFTYRVPKRPEPPPPPDRDGDGFVDAKDACPDEPGVAPDGCPRRDTDGDGFLDRDDACPKVPGVAPDGCPIPDTDGDGILDPDDACVDEPETKNGYQDDDGCPDELPEPVKEFSGVIEGIEFDFNEATIKPESKPVLDKAIEVLKEFPEIRVEIVGHTDNVGTREFNLELSRRRAEAVRDYLVRGGIDPSRLRVRGAGPDEPIAPNDTEEGRAKNRRTEFRILTKDDEPDTGPKDRAKGQAQ